MLISTNKQRKKLSKQCNTSISQTQYMPTCLAHGRAASLVVVCLIFFWEIICACFETQTNTRMLQESMSLKGWINKLGKILTGYYTMWVKKEKVPVIHYLQFVLDFKLTTLKRKSLLIRLKEVQAKQAIFKLKQLKNTSWILHVVILAIVMLVVFLQCCFLSSSSLMSSDNVYFLKEC